MVGILDAQVAKLNPDIKKKVLRKILCVFLETISFMNNAKISIQNDCE